MINSVGAGKAGLNNQLPRKTREVPSSPFPKINGERVEVEQNSGSAEKPMMVGVKPKAHLTSIFDEKDGVVRLNADGDRLEVSKKAITMAKERFFSA